MTAPAICAMFLLAVASADQLDTVKSEPDLNRRAELAVDQADRDLDAARQSWQNGDWTKTQAALTNLKQAAELAGASLEQTDKQKAPRNNRHYKTVELKMRNLIRRVDAFRLEVDYDQRDAVNQVETRLQELHDKILDAVMTKRR
ncbi:MAG: hypothetical protein ABSF98_22810 [Bryobacteraceae bacterium]|jgi:hypothetical protein